jgi:hypothetical protein
MNREIKFRGIAINTKEIIYSMTISKGSIKRKKDCVFFEVEVGKWVGVYPQTVGQFTNLKDKNGVEIYESDVLKDSNSGIEWEIIFMQGAFYCSNDDDNLDMPLCMIEKWERLEVVGNIYKLEC